MDTFELNKIAGAILGSLLFILGVGFLAELIFTPHPLEQQAYVVEVPEAEASDGAETATEEVPLAVVLASGSLEAGERQAKKCAACHTFESGGANKIGPNLHGIVGRPKASHEGFAYSPALQAVAGEPWSYENLFAFIAGPKQYLPGTSMAFAGLKKAEDRADVIAYLRSVSPDAPPLPAPEETAAAETPAAEAASDTAATDSAAPDPATPGASEPAVSEPAVSEPAASEPAVSEPGAPAVSEPMPEGAAPQAPDAPAAPVGDAPAPAIPTPGAQ